MAVDAAKRPALEASNLLQQKWALPIVRVLLDAPRGFNELQRAVPGLGPTTLAQRLDRLEGAGIVWRTVESESPPRTSYQLTSTGLALRPVLEAMQHWALTHLDYRLVATRDGSRRAAEQARTQAGVAAVPVLLAIFQEKWALHIMCNLVDGPHGFTELGRAAGGVNTATLSQRLHRLEQLGVVARTVHSMIPPRTSYAPTESGQAFRPVVEAIWRWAIDHSWAGAGECRAGGSG